MGVLSTGFDFAFMISFILGIVILIIAVISRPKVHPDYLDKNEEIQTGTGLI
jgi:hypothetical protein